VGWDDAREAAIYFDHDTVLRRKLQDVLPRRVIVRVEVDLRGGNGFLLYLGVRASRLTWFTAGTTFPVLTIRCNHSRVKLLTPILLRATLNRPTKAHVNVWDVLGQPCLSDLDHVIPKSLNILDIPRAMYEVQIKMLESQLKRTPSK
jgi:hypothetical protein